MYQDSKNEYGCPLFDQNGRAGIRDFDAIVARLAPELRAAFEAERAARWLEMKRNTNAPNTEWWEYQRFVMLVRQFWFTQPRLHGGKDVLAGQVEQLRPWLRAWQPTANRLGAAVASARGVQGIPEQVRHLHKWVPSYKPNILVNRAVAFQPLGHWLGLVDGLLDRGRRSCYVARTTPKQRGAGEDEALSGRHKQFCGAKDLGKALAVDHDRVILR